MRFVNWDRLLSTFGNAEWENTQRERGEVEAAVVTIDGIAIRISAGLGDQVGLQLFQSFRAERRLASGDWDTATVNKMNNTSAAIAQLKPEALLIVFPFASIELASENEALAFAMEELGLGAVRKAPAREIMLRLEQEFSTHLGLIDDAEGYIRSIPSNDDVIFASRDTTEQRCYFNILIGDGFVEDAAVRDYCGHLVSADFYDPHYRSTARSDVSDAQVRGRSTAYKLFYANQWNCEHGLKYWRLRAAVLSDRLLFRMPFLAPHGGSLDFTREFDAINLVMSHGFHYRSRTWQQIRSGNLITKLGKHFAMDILQKSFFQP